MTIAWRSLFLLVTGILIMVVYFQINHRPIEAPVVVFMPDWVPFIPALTILYLGVMIVPWFLQSAAKSQERFITCFGAHVSGIALIYSIWILYPTEMARPPVSMGWSHGPYRWLVEVDRPTNILPCGHILPSVITTWFLVSERRSWLKVMVLMVLSGTVSIVATWQHRPVDIVIGIGIAVLAIGCSEWFAKCWKRWLPFRNAVSPRIS